MKLDFSKCETPADVAKVFTPEEVATFEMLKQFAAKLDRNLLQVSRAVRSFEPGRYGEMKMAEVLEPTKKGVVILDHISMSQAQADMANLLNANKGHPQAAVLPGTYARLIVDGTLMMTDTPHEVRTCSKPMLHAHGKVLVAGMGLGVILIPMLRSKDVKLVHVVEKYQDVIDVVLPQIRKVLTEKEAAKLHVFCGDIFTWKPLRGFRYDCLWFDIWPDISTDNLKEIRKLHKRFKTYKYSTETSWMHSWLQDMLVARKREEDREDNARYGAIGGKLSAKARKKKHVTTNGKKVKL